MISFCNLFGKTNKKKTLFYRGKCLSFCLENIIKRKLVLDHNYLLNSLTKLIDQLFGSYCTFSVNVVNKNKYSGLYNHTDFPFYFSMQEFKTKYYLKINRSIFFFIVFLMIELHIWGWFFCHTIDMDCSSNGSRLLWLCILNPFH